MIITIDGPTASGKSTIAKDIAQKLNIYHLNTGLLYRSVAYILVNHFKYNEATITEPKQTDLDFIFDPKKFVYEFDNGEGYVIFNEKNITPFLKNKEIDYYSSIVSQNQKVRKVLISFQRDLAKLYDLVIEGRDCGSVVFPNADLKIYLTADLTTRAERWQQYMKSKGKNFSFEESLDIVSERDERDLNREISPLIIPQDAIVIDSSNLSEKEVFDTIINLYKNLEY